jgi:hypothetical protein
VQGPGWAASMYTIAGTGTRPSALTFLIYSCASKHGHQRNVIDTAKDRLSCHGFGCSRTGILPDSRQDFAAQHNFDGEVHSCDESCQVSGIRNFARVWQHAKHVLVYRRRFETW